MLALQVEEDSSNAESNSTEETKEDKQEEEKEGSAQQPPEKNDLAFLNDILSQLKAKEKEIEVTNEENSEAVTEEEEEERDPVQMTITNINPNGKMTILFSEEVYSIQEQGLNLTTLNLYKQTIFQLTY